MVETRAGARRGAAGAGDEGRDGWDEGGPRGRAITRKASLPGSRAVVGGFLVAAAAVGLFVASSRASQRAEVRFAVAAKNLPVGHTIAADDVVLAAMSLPDGTGARAFRTPDAIVGRVVIGPIAEGEVVQAGSLLAPARTPPFREVTVSVDADQTRGVVEGDTVDVLVTAGTGEASHTEVVVGGAHIVRIGDGRQGLGGANRPPVTFALASFEDVDRVVEAAHAGSLTLVRANGFQPQAPTFVPSSRARSSAP